MFFYDLLLFTRIDCCDFSRMSIVKLVVWLMLAFVLCREAPILFQKVKLGVFSFHVSPFR